MKTQLITVVSVAVLLTTGCVTEGGLALEAASDEEQAQAIYQVGAGYLQEGRIDYAIESLQRAIDLEPRMAQAHSAIGIAYDRSNEADLAEQHHRRATQLAPSDSGANNAFAVFLCRQGRWTDARPYYQRAIDNSRNQAPVILMSYMNNAATCARAAGDLESAEAMYRSVLNIDGANVEALRGMVELFIRSEEYLSGRAFWQRLEVASSLNPEDLLSCYIIESQLGDDIAARGCADRLRDEFPNSPVLSQLRELELDGG